VHFQLRIYQVYTQGRSRRLRENTRRYICIHFVVGFLSHAHKVKKDRTSAYMGDPKTCLSWCPCLIGFQIGTRHVYIDSALKLLSFRTHQPLSFLWCIQGGTCIILFFYFSSVQLETQILCGKFTAHNISIYFPANAYTTQCRKCKSKVFHATRCYFSNTLSLGCALLYFWSGRQSSVFRANSQHCTD